MHGKITLAPCLAPASDERFQFSLIAAAVLLIAFALIAVMDNGGALPFTSMFAGIRTIDPLQVVLVAALSMFAARLFLLGKESRRLIGAVRLQQSQQAAVRVLEDAAMLERHDKASEPDSRLV